MNQTLKNTAHPLRKTGGFFLPHLALITLVLGLVIGAFGGWNAHSAYDAHYFQSHYNVASQHIVIPGPGKPVPRLAHGAFPVTGSLDLLHYPSVGDQGPEGSCAAWAEAWLDSYQYRRTHLASHPFVRFSPKCQYNHYRISYSQGQDAGSWFDQDSELIPSIGTARYLKAPYPPWDPTTVTALPAACYNTTYRFSITHHVIDMNQGGGPGLIDAIKQAISTDHGVEFALPVTAQYDNATQTSGLVAFSSEDPNRGAHANVFIAWDDTIHFPNGDIGGLRARNQWSRLFGLNGDVWISYATVEKFIFGTETVSVG